MGFEPKELKELVDGVYFDSINGVPGTDWPIGTPGTPVNNITDAKVIAAARQTSTIVLVHGVITLDVGITGYRFVGNGFADPNEDFLENWIDLGGFTAAECSFEYINIDFDGLGTLDKCGHFLECSNVRPDTMTNCNNFLNCGFIYVDTMTDCNTFLNCGYMEAYTMTDCWDFFDCGFIYVDTMTDCNFFLNCGFIYIDTTMTNCNNFLNCGEADIDYDCTGQYLDPIMSFRTGRITVSNLTDAHTFTITGDGLRLILEASNIAGTFDIYGDVIVTNNSTSTVNDYSTHKSGKTATFTKQVTSAANAAPLTLATVMLQPIMIKSLVVRSNGATTANCTSIAITGGAGGVVTFISAIQGVRANIAAADQQVSWTGAVTFKAAGTIVMTFVGTGAAAHDLQVDIEYEAVVDTGYLA